MYSKNVVNLLATSEKILIIHVFRIENLVAPQVKTLKAFTPSPIQT